MIFLSFTVFFIFVFDGLLRGAKTGAFDRIAFFASIYFFMRCCKMRSLTLDFRIIRTIGYSFLLLIFVFESINVFIGRKERDNTHDKSSLFAIYCGAQIKNFDIYIKGNDGNYDTKYWGGETFKSFYNENDEKYFRPPGTFQKVGLNSLGNVYTNIYAYHKDFGGIGVWVLTFLSAFISMFIYNRVLNNLNKPYNRNIYLYIYSMFTIALFMSFFSPKFYEYTFTIGFLKRVILISICLYLFDRLTKISKHVVKI